MRMLRPALLAICLAALACGSGKAPGQCEHNFDCAAGEACVSGTCQAIPCGGCQPDEACGNDGQCVPAQGASCADHTCPSGFTCPSGVCTRSCVVSNSECDPGFYCLNKSCVECTNSDQCAAKTGGKARPVCDTTNGTCVECSVNFDCVKALGSGHYCDAHVCKEGCKATVDCNPNLGETCDTSTNPGKCIQCHTSSDCHDPSAPACDDTGHCVQCWGETQASANTYCGSGTPECNLPQKTCVECITDHDATGEDCGYPISATVRDPHYAKTCNGSNYTCVDGCKFDSQCGCPRNGPGGVEGACARYPDQEHCDPQRTTMAGVTGPTLGACVQCTDSAHCSYKITDAGHPNGTQNGSRCVNDSCVEGCDTDQDCYPDHATPNGKICHIGSPGDANNHKCVECQCDVLSADGTYCEFKSDMATRACTNTASGKPRVCDKDTLSCRRKHQNESCDNSNECGAQIFGSTCLPVTGTGDGFCVLKGNPDTPYPGAYCSPSHGQPGRCGNPCDDVCTCVASACHPADDTSGAHNKVCVSNACTY